MSSLEKTLAPPNSIIFIADPTRPCDVPVDTGAALVTATSTCICVGTLAEMDGETAIRLATTFETTVGNLAFERAIGENLDYQQGMLETYCSRP